MYVRAYLIAIRDHEACPHNTIGLSLRTLSSPAGAASVPPHRDSLLVLLDVLEELNSAVQLPAVDGLRGLAGVLVGDTKVGAPSAGALAVVDGLSCVSDHLCGRVLCALVG